MKVAIPVDERSLESEVCFSFGRTPLFLVYDIDTKESLFLDNSAIATTAGAGIQASQTIVDAGVEAMLTPRLGENAADVLKAGDIKIYKTDKDHNAIENINLYIEGKLPILDNIHPGFHGHGDNATNAGADATKADGASTNGGK